MFTRDAGLTGWKLDRVSLSCACEENILFHREGEERVQMKKLAAAFFMVISLGLCFGISAHAAQAPGSFVQDAQGVMWMEPDGTFLKNSWLEVAGLRYHLDQNGYVQVGLTEIDGKLYCLYPGIVVTSGWLQIGDGIYYFQADGTMAVNAVVDGFVLGSDGRLVAAVLPQPGTAQAAVMQQPGTAQAAVIYQPGAAQAAAQEPDTAQSALLQQVNGIIASVTTADMTSEQKLRACYQYVMDLSKYKRNTEVPSGDWTGRYAQEILSTGKGNCYRYASAVAYLAKGLGYEARVATGTVRSLQGGQTPHGWAEIYINGGWYVFDAVMEDSRHVDMFGRTYADYPYAPMIKEAEWAVHF